MYCIHYLWFNNLPGKLVMCHGQFWQVTNHISLVLEKKQNKTKNPDAIESLLKSYRTVLSNRMTSLWLTKFKVCSVSATDQVFLLGFLAQVQSVEEKEKGCETYSMDQENEVSKIFSVSLGSNKGRREGEIKFKKHISCVVQ